MLDSWSRELDNDCLAFRKRRMESLIVLKNCIIEIFVGTYSNPRKFFYTDSTQTNQ